MVYFLSRDYFNDCKNGLLSGLYDEIIDSLKKDNINIQFNASYSKDVGITHEVRTIKFDIGMVDYLAKLSEIIACSGTFSTSTATCRFSDFGNGEYEGFCDEKGPYEDQEINDLTKTCFATLMFYVISHERTHLLKEHPSLDTVIKENIETVILKVINYNEVGIGQVKEGEADLGGFINLIGKYTTSGIQFNFSNQEILSAVNNSALFYLIIIFVYHYSRALINNDKQNDFKLKHPPAEIRALSIISSLDLQMSKCEQQILIALVFEGADKVFESVNMSNRLELLGRLFDDLPSGYLEERALHNAIAQFARHKSKS